MKIAIIISGQPRSWKLCKWFHKNIIMNNNNCDVFLSIDSNNTTQLLHKNNNNYTSDLEVNEIISFYTPKNVYINSEHDDIELEKMCSLISEGECNNYTCDDIEQIHINRYLINQETPYLEDILKINDTMFKQNNKTIGYINKNTYYGILRQYYFLHKGYEMLHRHILQTDEHYDSIIRMRFDHVLWDTKFHKKELYVFDKVIMPNNITHSHQDIKYTKNNIQLAETITKGCTIDIDISEINTIKVLGGGVYKNYTYVNDFFWVHGQDIVHKMLLWFNSLIYIINNSKQTGFPSHGAVIEHFFSIFLFNQQINIKKTIMSNMTIIRTDE
jgi:hypothetical protein